MINQKYISKRINNNQIINKIKLYLKLLLMIKFYKTTIKDNNLKLEILLNNLKFQTETNSLFKILIALNKIPNKLMNS